MPLDLPALEKSFDLVRPHGDELMDSFYARPFAAAPAVSPLFAGVDLPRQKTMLLAALVLLRRSLRDLGAIVPKLRELGAATWPTAAEPDRYPTAGQALIGAMANILRDEPVIADPFQPSGIVGHLLCMRRAAAGAYSRTPSHPSPHEQR